jgi:hypothetical protein
VSDDVGFVDLVLRDEAGQKFGILVERVCDRWVAEDVRPHAELAFEVALDQVHADAMPPDPVSADNCVYRVHPAVADWT